MLVPYKSANRKIAMGLLSFMRKEKDVKRLLKTMEQYENDPDWKLYLWKEDDYIGVIGVSIEGREAKVRHICVNPSFREEGIGTKMLASLKQMLPCEVKPTKYTKTFVAACEEKEAEARKS